MIWRGSVLSSLAGKEVKEDPEQKERNGKDSTHQHPVSETSPCLNAHVLHGAQAYAQGLVTGAGIEETPSMEPPMALAATKRTSADGPVQDIDRSGSFGDANIGATAMRTFHDQGQGESESTAS